MVLIVCMDEAFLSYHLNIASNYCRWTRLKRMFPLVLHHLLIFFLFLIFLESTISLIIKLINVHVWSLI